MRDAGLSLSPLLSFSEANAAVHMPRRLKERIAEALTRADGADGENVVTNQPMRKTAAVVITGTSKRPTSNPVVYYHGLFSCSVGCCLRMCCYPCTLGEVYGNLSGTGCLGGTCIICAKKCIATSVATALCNIVFPGVGTGVGPGVGQFVTAPVDCYVRNKLNSRFNIVEDPLVTCVYVWCCAPCSAVQMNSEFYFREALQTKNN